MLAIFVSADTISFAYASNLTGESEKTTEQASEPLVSEALAVDLKINKKQENDTFNFEVENMFPGDSIRQTYNIHVSCNKDVTVKFHAKTNGESQKLSEVLKTKITLVETDQTIYDGSIIDMPKSLDFKIETAESTTKTLKYDMVVYLDTSVGNEYMGLGQDVTFEWWVEEVDNLDNPKTGDDSNITMWMVVMAVSATLIVILLLKTKKEEKECEAIEIPPKD